MLLVVVSSMDHMEQKYSQKSNNHMEINGSMLVQYSQKILEPYLEHLDQWCQSSINQPFDCLTPLPQAICARGVALQSHHPPGAWFGHRRPAVSLPGRNGMGPARELLRWTSSSTWTVTSRSASPALGCQDGVTMANVWGYDASESCMIVVNTL